MQPNERFESDLAKRCALYSAPQADRWANMNKLIIGIIVLSSLVVGTVVADGSCATEQCEEAQKIPNLPTDVKSFVEQRDGCDYFRGEPWPEGNDPGDKERRDFISKNLNNLCTGSDRSLKELRNKYRDNRAIAELLRKYEDRIERR